MDIPIIILAAGNSSRLGRPKQLLPYQGKSLLRHAVDTALLAKTGEVIVVVGSRANQIQKDINRLSVKIVMNHGWEAGMGGSISTGMQQVPQMSVGVLLMLCDQPQLSADHLIDLARSHKEKHHPIVASSYGGQLGVPACFSSAYFSQLSHLSGQTGAKKLLIQHQPLVHSLPFPKGMLDVDTEEDYQRLISTESDSQS
ncbi:MAG: nucleotidyltransferase family protein [Bacteroidota bacterium]